MTTETMEKEYTPEDLLTMPDGDRYELVNGRLVERHPDGDRYLLVNGRLVERHMGWISDWVAGQFHVLLSIFCKEHRLGWVWMPNSGGFQGFPNSPRTVRKPDVVFLRFGRLPGEQLPHGHGTIPPDLAVEVISANDLYEEVDQKIEEYLRAGVRLVWIISTQNRTVRIHRVNGTSHSAREHDELDGEDVLPGFRCRVGDPFLSPQPPSEPTNGSN
jgi:Uma2 family endonuclease